MPLYIRIPESVNPISATRKGLKEHFVYAEGNNTEEGMITVYGLPINTRTVVCIETRFESNFSSWSSVSDATLVLTVFNT